MKRFSNVVVLLAAGAAALAMGLPVALGQDAAASKPATVTMDGSTTVGPIAKAFAEFYMALHPEVNVTVKESGSGNGATSLISGDCDIANMSRFMKDKEFKTAVDKGIMPVAHVVAMDGIAIVVHPNNPVAAKGLAIEQIRGIYKGEISNWKAVGGPDAPIHRISRDTSSGTYETFHELVMNKEANASDTETVGASAAIRARIQSTENAIGYVGIGFIDPTIKAIAVNGVACTDDTVASGQYPVARPLFMFTNGYPKLGGHVHALVTMHLTKAGQEIVRSAGFVPVTKYQQ